jgi:Lrp/AsnC family leucine-responsive transcriptional regulator
MRQSRSRDLDEIDRKILRALQMEARLTTSELAGRVGVSPSPCWTRVKRLEEAGYITGYVALLDQEKLGFPDTVLVEVTLERHEEEVLDRFGRALAGLPEVLEAYLTTGEYDYLIKVAVAGTTGYERFLREKLYRIPGIRQAALRLRCVV